MFLVVGLTGGSRRFGHLGVHVAASESIDPASGSMPTSLDPNCVRSPLAGGAREQTLAERVNARPVVHVEIRVPVRRTTGWGVRVGQCQAVGRRAVSDR
jgi:hypothetical protein